MPHVSDAASGRCGIVGQWPPIGVTALRPTSFTACGVQISLPAAVADEKKRVVEDVAKDRQHSIDAAIVRTMKSRKVMQHQQVGR